MEKECLAIVWAIKTYRPYMYGIKLVVNSDHKALKWLNNVKDQTYRLDRWKYQLEEYDFSI